jgi:hypothetical protein
MALVRKLDFSAPHPPPDQALKAPRDGIWRDGVRYELAYCDCCSELVSMPAARIAEARDGAPPMCDDCIEFLDQELRAKHEDDAAPTLPELDDLPADYDDEEEVV